MASSAQQKLKAFRQRRSSPGPLSAQDKLRKYRARSVEDEDEDESFVDQVGDLGKRIWYGETEDPWFDRTDEEGIEKYPFMGEVRGKMGLEDILPYAAQAISPETPMALAKLGYGLSKISGSALKPPTTDPNVIFAQKAVKEGVGSVTDLFGNPLDKDYYPTEGLMNLAAGLTPGLKALNLPKAARASSIIADPISPAVGAGARAVKKGIEKAAPIIAKAEPAVAKVKKAAKKAGEPIKGFSRFVKDVKIPGRNLQTEFTQAMQSFFTNMEPEFVDRMHQYALDENLSQRMHDARLSPKPTMNKVIAKIKAYANQKQKAATESFGAAKKAAVDEYGNLGVSTMPAATLPLSINSALSDPVRGFGGRLKVRWKAIEKREDPKKPGEYIDVEVEKEAVMNRDGDFVDRDGRLRTDIDEDNFKWDVEWIRKEATMGNKAENQVRNHLRQMLNSEEKIKGERSLSVQQGLTYVERNNSSIKAMKANKRPAAALSSRLREAELAAIDEVLPENARAYMGEYKRHNAMLDQIEEDFGVKPYMDNISRKKLKNKLQSAFAGNEGTDNITKLETIIGKEGVADIVGAQHFGMFGGGLVVRSEVSNVGKLLGNLPLAVATTGAAGGGILGFHALGALGAAAGGILTAIPLMTVISPRAMLEVSRFLGRHPKWKKLTTGRGDVQIKPEALQSLIVNVRQIAQKLKKRNIDVKTLAAQGMTLGQLIQRLEPEE